MPSPLPRRDHWRCRSWLGLFQPVALSPTTAAFPKCLMGRLPRTTFRGLNSVHMTLRPAYSPHRQAACCLEGFDGFVTSTAAPIATGWSDLCRVGIAPTEKLHLFTTHRHPSVNPRRWMDRGTLDQESVRDRPAPFIHFPTSGAKGDTHPLIRVDGWTEVRWTKKVSATAPPLLSIFPPKGGCLLYRLSQVNWSNNLRSRVA